ncbi:hypothetical protein RJ639_036406 [Escallonia herrerae]|uniref:Phosphorylated adapter RNA export protein n=1 Tax=Escallonia herrerae TaxID=1293975 RepID=A0AA88WR52_9ASTE|nr:hypothetical protein RJ639_036406 [Escallonia herrerae]
MDGGESILDSIFGEEHLEDAPDVEMFDVEEGEVIERNLQSEAGQKSGGNSSVVNQESRSKNRRRKDNKKRNKRKKGSSGSNVIDVNRFVLDVCKRLKERKSYLVWTAVGCLGVSALSDLVKEVDAIQACGGQKTANERRFRTGGGILWSILKVRDPNAYKEIMKKGKEFEVRYGPFIEKHEAPYFLKCMTWDGLSHGGLFSTHACRKMDHLGEPSKSRVSVVVPCGYAFVNLTTMQKQFKNQDIRSAPVQNNHASAQGTIHAPIYQATETVSDGPPLVPSLQNQLEQPILEQKRKSVHDRIRIPVTYDDLPGAAEDAKDESV